jgi:hypothetical protein
LKEGPIPGGVRELQAARPGLAIPKKVTRASQLEILLGQAEAVVGVTQRLKTRLRLAGQRLAEREQASAPLTRTPDAPPKLMKLSEPKALGLFDDDDVRRRDVDTDFQHGGSDQHPKLALSKRQHQRATLFTG